MINNSDCEYLTFILDGEEYGIDILCVQEIRIWSPVTELPGTPDYLKGVINLRGTIVPIVDLRERFERQPLDYTDETVIIILRAIKNEKKVTVGIVVDAVSEVYKFALRDIRPAPDLGSSVDSRFIGAMGAVEEKLVILLDTQKLLDVDELYQVSNSVRAAS